ncbi:hypothetical protein [Sphingomonas guangdongensis]|uniref:hypothetical protein n=1 Tax=Sphingomonas guangdongensis TaxID=1141890 RepID=UPI00118187C7|nr:hypothetical protein [Sphingomonas guangdongensis]
MRWLSSLGLAVSLTRSVDRLAAIAPDVLLSSHGGEFPAEDKDAPPEGLHDRPCRQVPEVAFLPSQLLVSSLPTVLLAREYPLNFGV